MSDYLMPFFEDEVKAYEESEILSNDNNEEYRDIAWDFENNIPIMANGDFKIVEGLEAVKSWAYRALHCDRYKYSAYTWDHGLDTEQFVGKVLNSKVKIDIIKEIKECMLQNKYITGCTDFNITAEKRKVYIKFNLVTKYGTFQEEVNY